MFTFTYAKTDKSNLLKLLYMHDSAGKFQIIKWPFLIGKVFCRLPHQESHYVTHKAMLNNLTPYMLNLKYCLCSFSDVCNTIMHYPCNASEATSYSLEVDILALQNKRTPKHVTSHHLHLRDKSHQLTLCTCASQLRVLKGTCLSKGCTPHCHYQIRDHHALITPKSDTTKLHCEARREASCRLIQLQVMSWVLSIEPWCCSRLTLKTNS